MIKEPAMTVITNFAFGPNQARRQADTNDAIYLELGSTLHVPEIKMIFQKRNTS